MTRINTTAKEKIATVADPNRSLSNIRIRLQSWFQSKVRDFPGRLFAGR
jgi:hypothetical protein